MINHPGIAIALEMIALSLGALVILACHRNELARNSFPKFIGYFVIIISFLGFICSSISCFSYWMDAGGSVLAPTKSSRESNGEPIYHNTDNTDANVDLKLVPYNNN